MALRYLVVSMLLVSATGDAGQDWMRESAGRSDFPAADAQIRSYQLMGQRARAAAVALKTAPDRAATFDLLLKSGRTADALTVLERIVASRPDDMRAAFAAVGFKAREMAADKARDHAERLRGAVEAAKRRLPSLPREEAAEIARYFVTIDGELGIATERDRNAWRRRLTAFVSEYSGTRTALLTQVELLTARIGPELLDAVDTFVREHAGTEAAAKALYQKGFHLGHNATSFGERSGDDPTDRFFRVVEISRELRSGRYPPSEWVDNALSLITDFFVYKPTYKPRNVERTLAVYEQVLPELLARYERGAGQESLSFLIGSRMGALFKLQGDPLVGIEATFERLEKLAKNPDAVRLLRAEFYLRPNDPVIEAKDRPALRLRAHELLERLVREGKGAERRRAMATLATLRFGNGDFSGARTLYQQFVTTYPESEYAWVAALRSAECEEASDPKRAVLSFHAAALFMPPPRVSHRIRWQRFLDTRTPPARPKRQAISPRLSPTFKLRCQPGTQDTVRGTRSFRGVRASLARCSLRI